MQKWVFQSRDTENQKNDVWDDTGTAFDGICSVKSLRRAEQGKTDIPERSQGEAVESSGAFGAAAMDKVDYE